MRTFLLTIYRLRILAELEQYSLLVAAAQEVVIPISTHGALQELYAQPSGHSPNRLYSIVSQLPHGSRSSWNSADMEVQVQMCDEVTSVRCV